MIKDKENLNISNTNLFAIQKIFKSDIRSMVNYMQSNQTKCFKNNILIWYDEYLNRGLDAIISNTSGCGTTLKDYGFIFREDKELKKKAKKIYNAA